jgi:TatD DNase family protein
MLIDTHSHLNFSAFKNDADETVKRALDENIWMINVGSQYSTSQRAVEIAEKCPEGVFAAIGIHPVHLSELVFKDKVDDDEEVEFYPSVEEFDEKKYLKLAQSKKVVAIGEIGLDYFHNSENKEKQKEVFSAQIDMAVKLDLPIILHCRKAHDDVIKIIREKKKQFGDKLRGVVHCFSGRLSQAKIYTEELGFYLGFNGIITFDRSYDKVLQEISLKYILTETDCPYLTPIPFRGKRNEPMYVKYVAEKISQIKEIAVSEAEKVTIEAAKDLFKI